MRLRAVLVFLAFVVLGIGGGIAVIDAASARGTAVSQPNIVIVDIDNLRIDHLPCYGYDRPTSPALCRFADDAVMFNQTITAAGWTVPSVAAMFSGQYPAANGLTTVNGRLPSRIDTLAEVLRRAGYSTIAFPGYRDERFQGNLIPRFRTDQGFDSYRPGLWLEGNARKSLRWMKETGPEPFFAYIHGNDMLRYYELRRMPNRSERPAWLRAGEPYTGVLKDAAVRREAARGSTDIVTRIMNDSSGTYLDLGNRTVPLGPADVQHVIDHYDRNIAVADDAFRTLVQGLRQQGHYDDTVIIVMSSHGDGLATPIEGSKRIFGHGVLTEGVIRVPMIIRVPGVEPGQVARQTELIDIFPTVQELAGAEEPDQRLHGTSLLPLIRGRSPVSWVVDRVRHLVTPPDPYAYVQGSDKSRQAVRSPDRKLLVRGEGDTVLFDVSADLPPAETAISDARAESRFQAELEEWRLRMANDASDRGNTTP